MGDFLSYYCWFNGGYIYIFTRWRFQRFVILIPLFGEMIQFDGHIFQMGWFNHQLDTLGTKN